MAGSRSNARASAGLSDGDWLRNDVKRSGSTAQGNPEVAGSLDRFETAPAALFRRALHRKGVGDDYTLGPAVEYRVGRAVTPLNGISLVDGRGGGLVGEAEGIRGDIITLLKGGVAVEGIELLEMHADLFAQRIVILFKITSFLTIRE